MQKKSSVKKVTKRTTKRPVMTTVPAPEVHECHCGTSCGCGCHGGKFKKFIILLIVFALGFAVAKITCCHGHRHMPKMQPKFENGCLVMDSIKCPKMQQNLIVADVDLNGCISREEFRAVKKSMFKEMREHREERDDD
ncbi:MAG: hypothetical protein J6Y07_00600 [Alphaproteobacteria bacterium]|nr:hypothetical protein [Alphaproteobacteria bacterium]